MPKPVVVGAVLYDPRVAVIWEIIAEFFEDKGIPIDTVFFTNYELQVDALLRGDIDVAWNSPLAWIDSQRRSEDGCRAIAMRDTDRDRQSFWVVKSGAGIKSIADLRGKTVAVGAKDSPQATLIPLDLLQRANLTVGEDVRVKRFDVLVGKHGDHIGGELEAFQCLSSGEADACAMLDLNWERWTADGAIDPGEYQILARTDRFDHCVFTARSDFPADVLSAWLDALFSMSYDNPKHREMMDLEGLKQWQEGRTSGFGPVQHAVSSLKFFESAAL